MSNETGPRATGVDSNWTHGSVGTYRQGCRCSRCIEAKRRARRNETDRRPAGRIHPQRTDPEPDLCPSCFTHHRGECL